MKRTNLKIIIVGAVPLILAGCNLFNTPSEIVNTNNANTNNSNSTATDESFWMELALKQCEAAPWGNNFDTQVIADYYQTNFDITVYAVEVTPPPEGFVACAACGCPTGTIIGVQTNAAGRTELQQEDFTDAAPTNDSSLLQPSDETLNTNTNIIPETTTTANAAATAVSATTNSNNNATAGDSNLNAADAQLQQTAERVQKNWQNITPPTVLIQTRYLLFNLMILLIKFQIYPIPPSALCQPIITI